MQAMLVVTVICQLERIFNQSDVYVLCVVRDGWLSHFSKIRFGGARTKKKRWTQLGRYRFCGKWTENFVGNINSGVKDETLCYIDALTERG